MESKIWNTLLAEAMDDIKVKAMEEAKAEALEETETAFAQKLASIEAEYKAEAEERKAEVEAYKTQAEQAARLHINDMQQALENALITRFPQAPVRLMRDIRQLSQSSQFNDLIIALVAVQDVEEFEHKLQEVLHVGKN